MKTSKVLCLKDISLFIKKINIYNWPHTVFSYNVLNENEKR